MSAPWRAGMLRKARMLARVFTELDEGMEVVIGMRRDGPYDWAAIAAELSHTPAVTMRRFRWEAVSAADAALIYAMDMPPVPVVMAPRDGTHDFLDCDGWIVFSNSLEGFVIPSRPIGVYCADLIQKYVPEIFGGTAAEPMWAKQEETFSSWRRSRFVFSTTPATLADVVSYAGVDPERAMLVPTLIDPLLGSDAGVPADTVAGEPYILWVTNASPHKNAQGALAALRRYYGGEGGLRVVVCGQDTARLNPRADDRVPQSEVFGSEPLVLRHVEFAGEVNDGRYLSLLRSAAVVWHNVVVDNGTFVAFDAARAHRQFVSSDYPQIRYLCERYGVDGRFHPHDDPDAAARALLAAEADFRAGATPRHRLRGDDPAERREAYRGLLSRLLA
jgi:glycosyltransferase involved in cell wall biosynthesis